MVALRRRNRALTLSFPVIFLYLLPFVVVGLLVLAGYTGQVLVRRFTDHGRLERLVEENYGLKTRLASYSAAVDTFRQFLARTEEMDNRLRCASGLSLIPADVRLMGVGGVTAPTVNEDVDALMRRMRFEERSLAEIERAVETQDERLGRIPSIWPVRGWVASGYGMRRDPFTRRNTMHSGLDIVAPYGTPIVATADGMVTYAGWKYGWGRCVEIDHGNGLATFFAHCRSLNVREGESVKRGQQVARLGSSGRSTGAHLHYGLKRKGNWVNPRNYIITP